MIREEKKLTQQQLADAAGVSVASIRHHEQGLRLPYLTHAVQLARALGVSVEVLTDCDEMRPAAPVAHDGKKGARRDG